MIFEIVYECKIQILFDLTNLKNRKKNDDVYVLHCLILDHTIIWYILWAEGHLLWNKIFVIVIVMFECLPSVKMQKKKKKNTFVLQFVLGSHTI